MDRLPAPELDVLVIGELLVEVSALERLANGVPARLAFSGDALNVAAAAAAAGARTGLLARVPDDDLGDAILERLVELGVSTQCVVRGRGQHGVYLTHADPSGDRQFAYARAGSFGSSLSPDDLDLDLVRRTGVVTASGVAMAISDSSAATVVAAADAAACFVYDANFRPGLTSATAAAGALRTMASRAEVVKASHPGETGALLDLPTGAGPAATIAAIHALGAAHVVLTRGAGGALVSDDLDDRQRITPVPVVPAPALVDQTGAGDCLTGTVCSRIALGDDLVTAVRLGAAASSLSLGGQGGTGLVPTLAQTRAHLAASGRHEGASR